VGGRLQAGDGRELSLRVRLLLAAIAIVAVSLTLSGALTGVLVLGVENNDTLDQMSKQALLLRPQIATAEQSLLTPPCMRKGLVGRPPHEACISISQDLANLLYTNPGQIQLPAGDRLILLDRPPAIRGLPVRQPQVLYDSAGTILPGTLLPIEGQSTVAGQQFGKWQRQLNGVDDLVGAAHVYTNHVSWVVLVRPKAAVASQAAGQLVAPLLESAGAGLVLAIVVTMLLGRAFTRPLGELRRAAEDIAGGNYARRVRVTAGDEIGVVGEAFNGMAAAVERARHQQRTFLANVSHELKTPLTSLIGFSQALMDGSLRTDAEKARAATILHEEARRVLRMSQELLDLARMESGQLALNRQPVDLGVQLKQEIEIVRQRAEARRLTLRLMAPPALAPVQADPDRLHQILDNLLDNAVKYAPEGTTVWISAEDAPGDRIVTAVRNRLGVRPPDPQRMFDRFYRGDPTRSSATGVGLGLAISRELAIAQDGDLRAELSADGTLSMRLDLPRAEQPPPPVESPARSPVRLSPRPQLRP
jgi:signal transduction histidine kinase